MIIELLSKDARKLFQIFEFLDRCRCRNEENLNKTKQKNQKQYDIIEWVIKDKTLYGYIIDQFNNIIIETTFLFDQVNIENAFLFFKTNNSIFIKKNTIINKSSSMKLKFKINTVDKLIELEREDNTLKIKSQVDICMSSTVDNSLPITLNHVSEVIKISVEDLLKINKNFKNYNFLKLRIKDKNLIIHLNKESSILIPINNDNIEFDEIEIPPYIFEPWKKSVITGSTMMELSITNSHLCLFYQVDNYMIKMCIKMK